MGRSLNNKETTVIKNTIRRLSKMCDSPTLYVGHTTAIEWAMLMLEDALNGNHDHLTGFSKAVALGTALKWEEAKHENHLLNEAKRALHGKVARGEL